MSWNKCVVLCKEGGKRLTQKKTNWWFQPISKTISQIGSFSQVVRWKWQQPKKNMGDPTPPKTGPTLQRCPPLHRRARAATASAEPAASGGHNDYNHWILRLPTCWIKSWYVIFVWRFLPSRTCCEHEIHVVATSGTPPRKLAFWTWKSHRKGETSIVTNHQIIWVQNAS